MSLLTNSNTDNLPQKKLDASWQFNDVRTWQLPNKQDASTQTYLTSKKTTFQNISKTSETTDLLIIKDKPNQTFLISSKQAKTNADQTIELSDNVQIKIINKKNQRTQILNTEKITYNDTDKMIVSETTTHLKQENLTVVGDQFSANLKTGTYQFKGNIKTTLIHSSPTY